MKAGDIQMQLAATNRWWRDPGWAAADPDLRRARSTALDYRAGCLRGLQPGGLYVLKGPRRAGKSTEIKYAIQELLDSGIPARNIIHATVDGWRDIDIRTMISASSRTFLSRSVGVRYWFIDEITSVTGDWPNVIKNLRDNDTAFAEDTVVLTGSSAARLHEVRKALAGRRGPASNSDRTLLPMRFTDFVTAAGVRLPGTPAVQAAAVREQPARDAAHMLLPHLADVVPLWEAYLTVGGFPQAVASWSAAGDVDKLLVDALWDVVYGDAISAARMSATQALTLLSRLTVNLCSPLNLAGLARDLDVAQSTVRDRLVDLAESFLLWPCHQEQGLLPKLNAQSKWYFTDPLLAGLAARRGFGRAPDLTQLSEQQMGFALARSTSADSVGELAQYDSVLYYRSATRSEIDFVGRPFRGMGFESKYTDDATARAAQTIRAAGWQGVIASRSVLEWGDEVDVIPTAVLVLLLGC